jgi:uncharacterized membrane protein HdeD (DUF308 family)
MAQQTPSGFVRQASTLSIFACSLIILGMLAVGSPLLAGRRGQRAHCLAPGFGRRGPLDRCFSLRGWQFDLRVLVGLAYLFFGVYLIMHPALGVASLTLVLASLFLVEGILNIVLFFQVRSIQGSAWLLIDGIITLLLGLMIYLQWPSSSAWAIGVGSQMVIDGVSRVMLSLAVRKVTDTISRSWLLKRGNPLTASRVGEAKGLHASG